MRVRNEASLWLYDCDGPFPAAAWPAFRTMAASEIDPYETAVTAEIGDSATPPADSRRHAGSGACFTIAVFLFLVTGLIASPPRDLWPFYLVALLVSVLGLVRARSRSGRVIGALLCGIVGASFFHCLWLDRGPTAAHMKASKLRAKQVSEPEH